MSQKLVVRKVDLFASNGSAAVRWIRSIRTTFGPNAEAPDRLASDSVCVLSLQIFEVEGEVQLRKGNVPPLNEFNVSR